MNRIDSGQIDDARFDLLADGELSEAEHRQFLGGLDDEPGGWRRCALALLESQEWKRQLGAIARQSGPYAADTRPAGRRRPGFGGKTLAAMAASFLVALLLGLVIRDLSHRAEPGGLPAVQVADKTSPRPDRPPVPTQMAADANPITADANSIAVPVGRVDDLDEWLDRLPAAVPEDVQRALERSGYRVYQTRELVPMGVKDGRRLVVPVDKVNIRYVGNPPL